MITGELEDGVLYGHRSPRSHMRKAAVLLVLSALCIAAVPTVVFDILHIRGKTDEARATAADARRPIVERIDGVVASVEDGLRTIELLRALSKEDGAVGEQARHALAVICGKSR